MKKLVMFSFAMLVVAAFAFAGGGEEETPSRGNYEDGFYFAQAEEFADSGWKSVVYFDVEDGSIARAMWTGAHRTGGVDKYTASNNGEYGMVANSDAQAPWYEQADGTVEWLLDTQNPAEVVLNDEGGTDAISGVSITVSGFFTLVEKAIEEGPVGRGPYDDGAYSAQADEFGENGWRDQVSVTVIGGYITSVYWDAVNEAGDSKKEQSEAGEYGMVANSDAEVAWYEQARAVEEWVVENQDPSEMALTNDGRPDAVSGVSIHVTGFLDLVEEALSDA